MNSSPASAGPRVPDTGASTNITSGRCAATTPASSSVAATPMVPICAQTAPGAIAASMPASSAADRVAAAPDRIVMTTPARARPRRPGRRAPPHRPQRDPTFRA